MESVTLTRTIDAQPGAVTDAMDDLEPFMVAAGFDEVTVEGEELAVANLVGIAEIELTLEVVDDTGAALAYEQREGIFEDMATRYSVEAIGDGSEDGSADDITEVTATTEFALDVAIVGGILDATVIKRQRRRELAAQLDWVEENSESGGD